MGEKRTAKRSTVRHTRAIQRDRRTRPTVAPSAPQVEARLAEVVHPATLAQVAAFRDLGLRERALTLPVMVAFVLRLVWRQFGSVSEAVRVLGEEGLLWADPLEVSPQAISARLRRFPRRCSSAPCWTRCRGCTRAGGRAAGPSRRRWPGRSGTSRRPKRWTARRWTRCCAMRPGAPGLLRGGAGPALAGRMAARLDVPSRPPRQVWYEGDARAHDQRFWDRAVAALVPNSLLLFDAGFLHYAHFDQLTDRGIWFLTRPAANTEYRAERVLAASATCRDRLVRLGSRKGHRCARPMRLLEVRHRGRWYRYLTNVTDPRRLPAEHAAALYAQRWRAEDTCNAVKRLLGLAYFWTGAVNGVMVQVWATWLLYAALVDLTDAVAEELAVPFQELSLEMVYRGLYHFTQAHHRGAADEPVAYLAAKAKRLGVLKRKRPAPGRVTIRGDP